MTGDKGRQWRLAMLAVGMLLALGWAAGPAAAAERDELFEPVEEDAAAAQPEAAPASRDDLFGEEPGAPAKLEGTEPSAWRGFVQFEAARTIDSPVHWSKQLTRAEVGTQGRIGPDVKWKVSARVDYDLVYDSTDFYSDEVRRDQRFDVLLRENYLDFGAGEWEFRLGRQHVVWGEMVGLFFADVVSAKDMREFILPEFDILRIPQWAARAEYFKDDFHAELLWIPVASYDKIGKPGSEFFPPALVVPEGVATAFRQEVRPERNADNMNYGLRLSLLRDGWDVSGFYYRSTDASPTFYREIVTDPQPTAVFEARHDRIDQYGGTVAKDLGSFVLKGEAVYTKGRSFNVVNITDPDGVVPQDILDWALGLDFTLPRDARLNLQFFQRAHFDHDPDIIAERYENGYSVLLSGEVSDKLEAQALWIASLERNDWLLRPRLTWQFERNWRLAAGVDIFKGPPLGFFGRFDNRDRVYAELRRSF